ncbi:hypothetical protein [Bacillus seohaeanensis]|uniref:Uncharacterized protein n=1 Tax=Bacillus seohaeanensis TaxID=284580 RepID=A0ABW5RUF9_9BACI
MKQRYILSLLLAAAMLYYALPRLNIATGGLEGIFALSWLGFALIVILGNLSAALFAPKRLQPKRKRSISSNKSERHRSFG